ncbi:MAG: hypothetical protein U0Q12_03110 [Vicinamibacterales bacterium]
MPRAKPIKPAVKALPASARLSPARELPPSPTVARRKSTSRRREDVLIKSPVPGQGEDQC